MKTFRDTRDRQWEIALNVAVVKRVRDLLKVDLLDLDDGKLIDRLANDPVLLVDVIYVACKDQADKAGVSDTQFGEAMSGESIDTATAALLEELVGFFRDPRRRTMLRQLLDKSRELEGKLLERVKTEADRLNIDELLATRFSQSATSSPVSSESTPAPSLSPT